jgi:1-acyl-sn-glycerol-3-phosphate acyltransferase
MKPLKWIVTYGCKLGLHMVYRIDASDIAKVPMQGPLMFYTNHSGLVEAPLIYAELAPRERVTGLGKIELFENPFLNLVFKQWEIIPVRRGEADLEAMRACVEKLKAGYILGISPEGTRNRAGVLQRAQSGIAVIALHSGAPLQPIAHSGGNLLGASLKRFRRAPFSIRIGPVFRLDPHGQKVTKEMRQEMADEMMYQLALLMAEDKRGEYSDLSKLTTRWLTFA